MKRALIVFAAVAALSACTTQQLNDGTFAASLAFVALKAVGVPF